MYPAKQFALTEAEVWAVLAKRGFGSVTLYRDGAFSVSHVPFVCDVTNHTLECHLAVNNPMIKQLIEHDKSPVLLICHSEDAYIRPDWYKLPNQVPTWNYLVAEVHGTMTTLAETETRRHLVDVSHQFEQYFTLPWTLDKLEEKQIQAMIRAIRVFRLDVTSVSGHRKMSQHKPKEAKQDMFNAMQLHQSESILFESLRDHISES